MTPRHAVVLLAAGGSRRLGEPKQLVEAGGVSLVRRAARAALATDPSQALVVLGAHADAVWSAVSDLPLTRIDCADWASGLSASIRAGLRALDPTADGALFVVCDQPGLTASHLRVLVMRWRSKPQRAVASAYAGTVGVPAILPRSWFHELQALDGDMGARDLLRARAAEVTAVQAPPLAYDLDRPTDLDRLRMDTTPRRIIDAWAQHPTRRHLEQPMFESLRRWTRGTLPQGELPVSATIAAMDEAGVGLSLISAWVGPGGDLISNDEVASFVAQAPDRLAGIGSVNITRPRAAVREVRRCIRELGFKGIRVLPWLWELPPTHARFYPVYEECCELGVPFCTQVGHTGPLMPSEVGRPIPYIDQVAIDFPELVVVCGHIGYPWTEEMIAVATKHPNVYIDTSAYTVRRYPPALVAYLRTHGRAKVLFGTNWPMIAPRKALEGLAELALPAEVEAAFLAANASRVFGFPAADQGQDDQSQAQ